MPALFFRTICIYFLITAVLRIMGKRQVGEMELSELVTTLLLSEIATLPIDDTDIPLLHAVLPILLIFSVEVIITYLKTKWNPLKRIFESKPVFLIERGHLHQEELVRNRISINEFLGELRIQGIPDISEVYYAILEQDGKLSVVKRAEAGTEDPGIAHALIADGCINEDALSHVGLQKEDVISLCRREGVQVDEVFLLQRNDAGKVRVVKKEVRK